MQFTPDTLVATSGGRLLRAGSREIRGAFVDSRDPVPGGLFVPIVAARDGHTFIPDAIAGGAAAVLQAPGRPLPAGPDVTVVEVDDTLAALSALGRAVRDRCAGPVVAISGSNGKTTTRAMIEAVLRSRWERVLATRGNLNNHLGVPLSLLNGPDDPEAIVLELGMSAPGENERLAALVRPHVAVITSVALEHLEFMGSLEAIAAAEAEPLRHVVAGGVAVAPDDEPLLAAHFPPDLSILRFGEGPEASVRIAGVELDERTHATLRLRVPGGPEEEIRVSLRVFGAHNARNAAAALAVGLHLGCPVGPMIEALEAVQPVGDRGRVLQFDEHHLLIADSYNANPGSVTSALHSLAALRPSRPGPLAAVIGDMLELGERGPELHAEVGRLAATLGLDALFTFGALSQSAAEAAKAGGIAAWHAGVCVSDLVAAVRATFAERPGALLVKGSRGMRLERVVEALLQAPPKSA